MHICLSSENLIISDKNLVYADRCYNNFISATSFNQFPHTCQQEQHL